MNLRKFLIFLLMIFLVSCATEPFIGKVTDKRMTPAYVEVIPPGYRQDCSVTIEGKFECGYKFFILSKTVHHAAKYYLTVSNDACTVEVSTEESIWDLVERGDTITVEILENSCQK